MGKIFVILLLVISACSHKQEPIVTVVEPPPTVTVIQPIPKPSRLSPTDKNYTAPYPALSTTKVVTSAPAAPAPTLKDLKPGQNATVLEKREFYVSVPRGAVSTSEFLGTKKRSIYQKDEVLVVEKSATTNTVLDRAMKLPPKEIEEGKYRTFRRIEDDIAHDSRRMRGVIAEFIFPEMNEVKPKPVAKMQPEAFCYGSLGEATCYSSPIKGQEHRRIGKPITLLEVYPVPQSP